MRKSHRPNHDASVHDAWVVAIMLTFGIALFSLVLAISLMPYTTFPASAEPSDEPGIAVSVEIAPRHTESTSNSAASDSTVRTSTCWHPPYKIDQPPQSWCDLRGNLTIDPTD